MNQAVEKQHHPSLAPSSWPGIMQCPRYEGGGGTLVDASKGQAFHDYMVALTLTVGPEFTSELMDQEDREDCEDTLKSAMEILDHELPEPYTQTLEARVYLKDDAGGVVTYGFGDVLRATDDAVAVLDWKSGFGWDMTKVDYWPQIHCYALAEMQRLGKEKALCMIGYIKPRRVLTQWVTFDEAAATAQAVMQRRLDENAERHRCTWCKYCRRLKWCPAVNSSVSLLFRGFGKLDWIEKYGEGLPEYTFKPKAITDPEQMSQLLLLSREQLAPLEKQLKEAREQIEAAALALTENQVVIPWYKRKEKAGRKTITKPLAVKQALGLTDTEFAGIVSIRLGEMAKVYAAKHTMKVKDARAEAEGKLFELITTGEPSYSLDFYREEQDVR